MDIGDIFKKECKHKFPLKTEDNLGYWWYQGETKVLVWDINGVALNDTDMTYETVDDFLEGKIVWVKMFNHLGRKVHEWEIKKPTSTIAIEIDHKLAECIPSGIYTFSVAVHGRTGMELELEKSREKEYEIR
jgi:hypothetical protein